MPTAYLLTGEPETSVHPIAGEAIVGRGEEADLRLSEITVSRRHASVRLDGHTVVVSDLDSANGTFVNGERIFEGTRAEDGDLIRFGTIEVRVRVSSGEPEQPTPTEILSQPD